MHYSQCCTAAGVNKKAVLFCKKEPKNSCQLVFVVGRRIRTLAKVFWFFVAKKNCLLPYPSSRPITRAV
jgi:hypothetical protein